VVVTVGVTKFVRADVGKVIVENLINESMFFVNCVIKWFLWVCLLEGLWWSKVILLLTFILREGRGYILLNGFSCLHLFVTMNVLLCLTIHV